MIAKHAAVFADKKRLHKQSGVNRQESDFFVTVNKSNRAQRQKWAAI